MKGKLTTKMIVIGILIVLLLTVATVATVIFLKDSGEASATEEKASTSATEGKDTNIEQNGNTTGENQDEEQNNTNNAVVGGNAVTQEPTPTTIEQERVVSEETKLNWNNSGMKGAETSVDSDELYIYYSNLNYKVEYIYEDVEETVVEVFEGNEKGKIIESYEDKIITGYKLDKVENLPLTITENQETNLIKVYYVKDEFTATFILNNGEENVIKTQDYGTELLAPEPQKEGHTFKGWNKEVPETMPAENTEYEAIWEVNQYTITYKVDGEVLGDVETYDYGTEITMKSEPEKEGYTFSGWDKTLPETMPAENIEINGTYRVNQYTITYKVDGEVFGDVETYNYGTEITIKSEPTKEGYTFSGWDKTLPETMPAEDLVISGAYTINQYTAIFVLNNGEANVVRKQNYGTELTEPTGFTKTGYTFKGWNKEVPETMPAENTEYEAIWEVNQYTITYKVDGEVFGEVEKYNYGEEITIKSEPTKEGYTFSGWDKTLTETMPAENIEINGTYRVNQYTITYKVDGEVFGDVETYSYGEEITIKSEPTKEGYTFSGWDKTLPETMPAEDLVISGTFAINKYTVTFIDYDGRILKEAIKYDHGTKAIKIAKPVIPTRPSTDKYSYTFAGWTPAIVDVTEDAIYQATYTETVNKYKVKFIDENGEVLKEETEYEYGTKAENIVKPQDPTKASNEQYTYTFEGWTPAIVDVTEDAIYQATYTETVNKYKVKFIDENGEVLKEETEYEYGTKAENIVKPQDPTKAADAQYTYTFAGWTPAIVDVTSDATYKATYTKTVRKYKVKFVDEDGKILKEETEYEYGTKAENIVKPQDPTKADDALYIYTFTGWTPVIANVTKDVTYKATYSKEAVNITLSKMAVDSNGKEVLALYEYSEGDIVNYKLTITNNGTKTIKTYTVTDTLSSELSFEGTQPAGTSVNGKILTWTISNLGAKETKSIIIKTKINSNAWSTTPQNSYNAIDVVNTNKTDKSVNCTFYIYNSKKGELPFEDGSTQHTSGYTEVGTGRVSGEKYNSNLTSIGNLNSVIDTHNMIEDVIEYAPVYDKLKEGEVILWYVSKNVYLDPHGNKYHVDGVIVNLNDIYAVTNSIKGSSNIFARDTILVKDK